MKENKLKSWVINHKLHLICIGSIVIVSVGTFLFIGSLNAAKKSVPLNVSMESIKAVYSGKEFINVSELEEKTLKAIDVREHLRNLPKGYHPSLKKISEAATLGLDLSENQTIVSSHVRCYAA